MRRRRHDPTPAGLLALAAAALMLSWLATTRWQQPEGGVKIAADYARAKRPAVRPWSELSLPEVQIDFSDIASAGDASWLGSLESQDSFSIAPPRVETDRDDTVWYLPASPKWTAQSAVAQPNGLLFIPLSRPVDWRVFGIDLSRLEPVGAKLASLRGAASLSIPSYEDLVGSGRRLPPSPTIASPPSLLGPVPGEPGERWAMRGIEGGAKLPSRQIRSRIAPLDSAVGQALPAHAARINLAPPTVLEAMLSELAQQESTHNWAEATRSEVAQLLQNTQNGEAHLAALNAAILSGLELADQLPASDAARLRRTVHALSRRTGVWAVALRVFSQPSTIARQAGESDRIVRERIAELKDKFGQEGHAAGWREFLLTDQIAEALDADPAARRELAYRTLARMSSPELTPEQRRFVNYGAIASLAEGLRDWAAAEADLGQTLADLEAYEAAPTPRLARIVVAHRDALRLSANANHRELADTIDNQYLHANLRFAVAGSLLDRFLPAQAPQQESVRDRIAGAPVAGSATTQARLAVRLLPDPAAMRMGLEATGDVRSNTHSRSGPVTIRNAGDASFVARKVISIDASGVEAWPAVVDASSSTQMVGLRTDYDHVPLLGQLVRSQARSEYQNRRQRAQIETEEKISRRVGHTLDQQTAPWLADLEKRFQENVLERADRLALRVDPVELRTTEDRFIARLRVLGEEQLGAHSPRNRAPSDSMLSVQLHESLINNALAGLDLGGIRMTPAQLRARLEDKLKPAQPLPAAEDPKVNLVLTEEEPVRVSLVQGMVELLINFRELTVEGATHRNFRVHSFYRPQALGVTATLRSTGPAQIEGRMSTASRLRLHAVFGKALPAEAEIPLLRQLEPDDRRLEGLMVTQFVVDDGWLGLAIGPSRGDRTAAVGSYIR